MYYKLKSISHNFYTHQYPLSLLHVLSIRFDTRGIRLLSLSVGYAAFRSLKIINLLKVQNTGKIFLVHVCNIAMLF